MEARRQEAAGRGVAKAFQGLRQLDGWRWRENRHGGWC